MGLCVGILELVEHVVNVGGILGHLVGELIVGKGLVAKQVGEFKASVGNLLHNLDVVELTTGALRVIHLVEVLAQIAT